MLASPTRIGLQIPSFEFGGVAPERLLETLSGIATTAEDNGFDSIWVMDHLNQIPGVGPMDHRMIEGKQYPVLVRLDGADLTLANAAAPDATFRALLLAIAVGLSAILPATIYLIRVYKTAPT